VDCQALFEKFLEVFLSHRHEALTPRKILSRQVSKAPPQKNRFSGHADTA